MKNNDDDYINQKEQEISLLQSKSDLKDMQMQQIQMAQEQEQSTNMLREQLDLSEELNTIEYLLRGYILKNDEHGIRQWTKPDNDELCILTEHGISLIMNTILFYINKNTLLSNYDEDTILEKMEDFASALNDTIFMEYEKVFKAPTEEDCQKVLVDRLNKKLQSIKFTCELKEEKFDEKKEKKKIVDETNDVRERQHIREQLMKNKLKRFLMIMREVQDAVHSSYLRAYAGVERRSLRQHLHISETRNPMNNFMNNNKKLNMLNQ